MKFHVATLSRSFTLFLAAVIFVLDQVSKRWVAGALVLGESRPVVKGVFNLTHVRNRGAAFGLFADVESPWAAVLLILFSALALVLVVGLLWRRQLPRLSALGLAIILGGAAGNLLDRIVQGSVVDFLYFHVGPYFWPAFNLADAAIVLGAGTLIYHVLAHRRDAVSEA